MPQHSLRFLLNGVPVEVAGMSPQTTLLEYLREERRLTGTKEGCAEGDCGACTVILAEPVPSGGLAWKPVNACIRLLPSVAGKGVFTVESLRLDDGTLHPVQRALVECHASQCGFCTPGFAMSLFGLYKNAHQPSRTAVDDALSGNLCRCTGYRPILDAAQAMYRMPPASSDNMGWRCPGRASDGSRTVSVEETQLAADIAVLAAQASPVYEAEDQRWFAPRTQDELAAVCSAHPSAHLVAGATDVGVWVTKQLRALGDLIYVGDCADMKQIRDAGTFVEIGAAVTLTDAFAALDGEWPELHEAWIRFGSVPIRNSGTLGGNVANGSPIGDSLPVLIALAATVVLRNGPATREIPIEDYYVGYQKTARIPGEYVAAVRIPHRPDGLLLRAYKISKRFDQDISSVFVCCALVVADGRVATARIGCGGVAPVPVRAPRTEASLIGRAWDDASAEAAATVLSAEFTPLTDMRASAGYRRAMLANLMRRFRLETGAMHVDTRVEDLRALVD
jgi:xanthine dehydrogenase small subunit